MPYGIRSKSEFTDDPNAGGLINYFDDNNEWITSSAEAGGLPADTPIFNSVEEAAGQLSQKGQFVPTPVAENVAPVLEQPKPVIQPIMTSGGLMPPIEVRPAQEEQLKPYFTDIRPKAEVIQEQQQLVAQKEMEGRYSVRHADENNQDVVTLFENHRPVRTILVQDFTRDQAGIYPPRTEEEMVSKAQQLKQSLVPRPISPTDATPVTSAQLLRPQDTAASVGMSISGPVARTGMVPGEAEALKAIEDKRKADIEDQSFVKTYKEDMYQKLDDFQKQEADEIKAYNDTANKARDDINTMASDIAKSQYRNYWADKGVFTKILATIMLVAGGVTSGAIGQENPVSKAINNAIDQDYKIQKANLELKKDALTDKYNVLNMLRTKFSDEKSQREGHRGLLLSSMNAWLDEQIAKNDNAQIKAALLAEKSKILADFNKARLDAAEMEAKIRVYNKNATEKDKDNEKERNWDAAYENAQKAMDNLEDYYKKYGKLFRQSPNARQAGKQLHSDLLLAIMPLYGLTPTILRSEAGKQTLNNLTGKPDEFITNPDDELARLKGILRGKLATKIKFGATGLTLENTPNEELEDTEAELEEFK